MAWVANMADMVNCFFLFLSIDFPNVNPVPPFFLIFHSQAQALLMKGWTSREIPDKLVECQEEYIDNGKESTTTVIGEENADVTTPLSDNLNLNHGVDDVKFREVEKKLEKNGIKNMPDSYTTLPRSFSRGKNISRSLVPKMSQFTNV